MPVPSRSAGTRTMRSNSQSMAALASFLTAATLRFVQDRTGLSGLYDWEMTYARDTTLRADPQSNANTPLSAPLSEAPPLTIALQEQLGLELVPARSQVEVLVIDSATLPEQD